MRHRPSQSSATCPSLVCEAARGPRLCHGVWRRVVRRYLSDSSTLSLQLGPSVVGAGRPSSVCMALTTVPGAGGFRSTWPAIAADSGIAAECSFSQAPTVLSRMAVGQPGSRPGRVSRPLRRRFLPAWKREGRHVVHLLGDSLACHRGCRGLRRTFPAMREVGAAGPAACGQAWSWISVVTEHGISANRSEARTCYRAIAQLPPQLQVAILDRKPRYRSESRPGTTLA